jgi:hypothetical protein
VQLQRKRITVYYILLSLKSVAPFYQSSTNDHVSSGKIKILSQPDIVQLPLSELTGDIFFAKRDLPLAIQDRWRHPSIRKPLVTTRKVRVGW